MKCSLCTGFCSTLCLCLAVSGAGALPDLDCHEWLERIAIEIPGIGCDESCAFEDAEDPRATEPESEDLDEDDEKHDFREAQGETAL